jgi:hypothetical protein
MTDVLDNTEQQNRALTQHSLEIQEEESDAFLPDLSNFIHWIGLNNKYQSFVVKGINWVFYFWICTDR